MKISESTFTIITNGFADGPAQPLRDYLLKNKAKQLLMVSHPLVAEGSNKHIVATYEKGKLKKQKAYKLPNKPPYTFGLDPFVPLKLPKTDAWFGFNNLAALKGLKRRRRGKAQKVFYWAVDFVPNRFGNNPLTRLYNNIDRKVCMQVDARIELTDTAIQKRPKYLELDANKIAPTVLAPMGTWLARTPKTKPSAWNQKRVVYMGHLVRRQGVATLIRALASLQKDIPVKAEIVGGGPLLDDLKSLTKKLGLANQVIFHGFVEDYADVEKILSEATVAVAPYVKSKENFTQFADPGKIKAYLGASLPIVLTDVPPNAKELEEAGAAVIVDDDPEAVAAGIKRLLSNEKKWQHARRSSANLAKDYDWDVIMKRTLGELGYE